MAAIRGFIEILSDDATIRSGARSGGQLRNLLPFSLRLIFLPFSVSFFFHFLPFFCSFFFSFSSSFLHLSSVSSFRFSSVSPSLSIFATETTNDLIVKTRDDSGTTGSLLRITLLSVKVTSRRYRLHASRNIHLHFEPE